MNKDKPIFLLPNRVWRTYLGGKLINKLHGGKEIDDDHFPEEWIGSVTKAINPKANSKGNEGLSKLIDHNGKIQTLKDTIAENKDRFLTKEHMRKYGLDTGYLVKILDSAERLTIQVHPDKEKAKELFNSTYGKTEAWYIIGGRRINGEEPYILLGFKEGITKEIWKELFENQDIEGMINSLHKIYVKSGEVYIIYGGVPHAIGAGCFLAEIQEPTDFTIRTEKITPSGLALSDKLIHQGLGFEKMFDCFNYITYSYIEVVKKFRIRDNSFFLKKDYENKLITYDDIEFFAMNYILVATDFRMIDIDNFSILIVLSGFGSLYYQNNFYDIKKGDQIFLPFSIKELYIKNTNPKSEVHILRFLPPKPI